MIRKSYRSVPPNELWSLPPAPATNDQATVDAWWRKVRIVLERAQNSSAGLNSNYTSITTPQADIMGTPYFNGIAEQAKRLVTPRRISLGGKISATGVSFDGTADIEINVDTLAVAPGDVALPESNLVVGSAGGAGAATAMSAIPLNRFGAPDGNMNMGARRLTNAANPTADQDVATKAYVDAAFSGDTYSEKFSFVIIGDTQYFTAASFSAISNWLSSNKDARNIRFVLHVGDVVDDSTNPTQWANAQNLAPGLADIPHLIVPGNHDGDDWYHPRVVTTYNTHYPQSYYTSKVWWDGGFYEAGHSENLYTRLTVGDSKYLLVGLEYGPRDAVLAWADGIVAAHPDYRVILLTHDHIWTDGRLKGISGAYDPEDTTDGNNGRNCWLKSYRKWPNLMTIINGHNLDTFREDGPHRSAAYGDYGNLVWQFLVDYQNHPTPQAGWGAPNTDHPWLRIYTVHGSQLIGETYDPVGDAYLTGNCHKHTLDLAMRPEAADIRKVMGTHRSRLAGGKVSDEALIFYAPMDELGGDGVRDVVSGTVGERFNSDADTSRPAWRSDDYGTALEFVDTVHDYDREGVRFPAEDLGAGYQQSLDKNLYSLYGPMSQGFTLSIRGKFSALANNQMLLAKHDVATTGSYYLALLPTGVLRFAIVTATPTRYTLETAAPVITDANWHHIAATWSVADGAMTIYLDGTAVATTTTELVALNNWVGPLYVGTYEGTTVDKWATTGRLCDPRIYARRLSATEIAALV